MQQRPQRWVKLVDVSMQEPIAEARSKFVRCTADTFSSAFEAALAKNAGGGGSGGAPPGHWNPTVHGLAYNVQKLLMEMDSELYDEEAEKYEAKQISLARRRKRRHGWPSKRWPARRPSSRDCWAGLVAGGQEVVGVSENNWSLTDEKANGSTHSQSLTRTVVARPRCHSISFIGCDTHHQR